MGKWSGKTGFQAMYCNTKGPTPLYTAHKKITILFYYIIVYNNEKSCTREARKPFKSLPKKKKNSHPLSEMCTENLLLGWFLLGRHTVALETVSVFENWNCTWKINLYL